MAAISVAFSACSVLRSTWYPPSVAEQPSGSGNGPEPRQNATPTPATTATTTTRTINRRNLMARSGGGSVGVQVGVQADPLTGPRTGLDCAGDRVATEEHVAGSGELGSLDHLRLGVHVPDGDL